MLRWLSEMLAPAPALARTELEAVVRKHLPEADGDTVRIVGAVAGLLGTVAYADRDYSAAEEARIRAELARVAGLSPAGIDAISGVLRQDIVRVATVEAPVYARELRELADHDLRVVVLDALVDLAAADDRITIDETNVLRQLATALGLEQADYNAAQERHKEKLQVLRHASGAAPKSEK